MKMISTTICNKKIQRMNLIPYDQKQFENVEQRGMVYAITESGAEMVIDRYGIVDSVVDVLIKTDSFTVALMAIFEILGENGIENL